MSRVVAPGPPTFELHTLGWRAFQDLCAAVMRTVLGQEVHAWENYRDSGYRSWSACRCSNRTVGDEVITVAPAAVASSPYALAAKELV